MMRVKDPHGPYMVASRRSAAACGAPTPQRGEAGGWAIYWEGIDNDGDGFFNEDGPAASISTATSSTSIPTTRPTPGRTWSASPRRAAVLDYIIEQPQHRRDPDLRRERQPDRARRRAARRSRARIDARPARLRESERRRRAQRRHVRRPPGAVLRRAARSAAATCGGAAARRRRPRRRRPRGRRRRRRRSTPADVEYFRTVSDRYRAADRHPQRAGRRGRPAARSSSTATTSSACPSFSTPGWGHRGSRAAAAGRGGRAPARRAGRRPRRRPQAAPRRRRAAGRRRCRRDPARRGTAAFDLRRSSRWMDAEKIDGFIAWTPFKHPTLGDVEIGGFKPYAVTNPPASQIAALGKSHAEFAIYSTSLFPQVAIADVERHEPSAAASTASRPRSRTPATCRRRRRTACCRAR